MIYIISFQTGKNSRPYKIPAVSCKTLDMFNPFWKYGLVITGKVRVQCGSNTGLRTKTRGFPQKTEVFHGFPRHVEMPAAFLAPVEFYRFWCYSRYGYESKIFFWVDRSTAIQGYGVGPRVWSDFDSCPNELILLRSLLLLQYGCRIFQTGYILIYTSMQCTKISYHILCRIWSLYFNSDSGIHALEATLWDPLSHFKPSQLSILILWQESVVLPTDLLSKNHQKPTYGSIQCS